jgi:phosphoribosylformylglycinamidine cyclo-ligase
MSHDAYKDAGVDIEAADDLIDRIKPMAQSTFRDGVLSGLGGFGGLFSLAGKYKDPVLVSGTDGVGTKLLVAQRLGQHKTIGIDLVAMCVNDIVVTGAEPLFFLDYFATGKLDPGVAADVVSGIANGCRQAGCALIGGETAEMPGMYAPGHYDLAGFAVGAVERAALVDTSRVAEGHALVGIPSSGLHSNGYSLVRKLLDDLDGTSSYDLGQPLNDALLTPTRIYVRDLAAAREAGDVIAAAHITGGGLLENLPRVLPDGLGAQLDGNWTVPPIFKLLAQRGSLSRRDLHRTFNMGLGMVLVVPEAQAKAVAKTIDGALVVGRVVRGEGVELR